MVWTFAHYFQNQSHQTCCHTVASVRTKPEIIKLYLLQPAWLVVGKGKGVGQMDSHAKRVGRALSSLFPTLLSIRARARPLSFSFSPTKCIFIITSTPVKLLYYCGLYFLETRFSFRFAAINSCARNISVIIML